MLLVFSGAVQAVHEAIDHRHTSAEPTASLAHACADHGRTDPLPTPAQPRDSDHDDCATCHLLVHVKASALDLASPTLPIAPSSFAAAVVSPELGACPSLGLPLGRGPPASRL